MSKIKLEFEFTYFMDENMSEEDQEYAMYKIEVNNVKLEKEEVENALMYINDYLRKEIGHCIIKNTYINDEYAVDIKTDQVDSTKIIDVLNKIHVKFKLLFNTEKVEELIQVGHNDLINNIKKLQM